MTHLRNKGFAHLGIQGGIADVFVDMVVESKGRKPRRVVWSLDAS